MNTVLKIILGLLALVVVLVLAAVIIIPLVVDPNDYRDRIAQAVEEETGRSFVIEGEISLSVFPWLGLEVGRMRLGNPPGFGDEAFAEIGAAGVGARLVPLLFRRQLEISTLRLDGLRANLVQLADGSNNWEDLADDSREPVDTPRDDGGRLQLERMDGLRLTDAVVRYEDRGAGTVVEAMIHNLSTGELAPGRAFPLTAAATVRLDEGATTIDGELGARVQFSDDFGAISLREVTLSADAEANGGNQSFSLRAPEIRVTTAGPAFEADGVELEFEVRGPDLPGGRQSGQASAPRISADLEQQTLQIPELTAEVAGMRAVADIAGTSIVDAPAFAGRLAVQEFSPRALMERLGEAVPRTADGSVLSTASLGARYRSTADEIRLDELQVVLDDTTLSGTTSVGLGEITRIRSQLALDAIDLDRYLPPEPADPEPGAAEDVELAFDWLRDLDLDAAFTAGSVKINGLTLTGLEARAVARDGVLTLQPFGAVLYGGQVRGTARLDARESPATFSMEQSLSALELMPFVRDLAGFDRLTGIAQLGAKLTTRAASTAGLMSGLNGELSFDVSDGAFTGINLWYEIQRANALARGRAAPERTSPDTEFRQLRGTAVIRDGVLVNQDLVGGLPFLGLTGRGEIDLAAGALDYRLNATVIREAIDEATGQRSELAGASLPLRLSGSVDSPSVSVDVGGLARDRLQQEAMERLGIDREDRGTVEEDLKDRAQDSIRRLRDRLRRDD